MTAVDLSVALWDQLKMTCSPDHCFTAQLVRLLNRRYCSGQSLFRFFFIAFIALTITHIWRVDDYVYFKRIRGLRLKVVQKHSSCHSNNKIYFKTIRSISTRATENKQMGMNCQWRSSSYFTPN